MEMILFAVIGVSSYWVTRELMQRDWRDSIIDLPEIKRSNVVQIGINGNKPLYHDFRKYAHMIVAGTTGYGKTNFLKCLISQVDGEVILIDLKGGFDFDKVTATNIHDAERILSDVVGRMKKRRREHIYVIIDEAGELYPPSHLDKEGKRPYLACLHYVSEIARLGRAFHVHLIYATQYPTSDIVPRQIKQCSESRLCFRLPTEIASRVALDESGAELLESGNIGLGIYKRDRKLLVKTYRYVERGHHFEVIREMESTENHDFVLHE